MLALLVSFSACAQQSHLDKFYQKYQALQHQDKDGISMDPSFLLNISFNRENARSSDDWFHKVTFLHCLIIDVNKTPSVREEWSDLSQSLRDDRFEEWFSVRKGKGRIQLLSRDGKNDGKEVVCLIVGEDGSGLFFHLGGHFTAHDMEKMQSALQDHDNQ